MEFASDTLQASHADGLGSVRALTDASGTLIQTSRTDPFGVPTATQGSSGQPFGFTGEPRDAETGFVYLRARLDDPQLGRFLQRDSLPQGGPGPQGLNRYVYAANNPVCWTDPSGTFIDTVVDVGFIAYDLYRIAADNIFGTQDNLKDNLTALGLDVGGALIPGVTGLGVVARAAHTVQRTFGPPARFATNAVVEQYGKVVAKGTVDLEPTLNRIRTGASFPHANDGTTFKNKGNPLPPQADPNYYTEYVHPTPGINGPGPQRVITGKGGEFYYTPDHYRTFVPLN